MMNIIQVVAADAANHGNSKSVTSQAEGKGPTKSAVPAKTSKAVTTPAVGMEKMKMN